jgi:hypothetical protein
VRAGLQNSLRRVATTVRGKLMERADKLLALASL